MPSFLQNWKYKNGLYELSTSMAVHTTNSAAMPPAHTILAGSGPCRSFSLHQPAKGVLQNAASSRMVRNVISP